MGRANTFSQPPPVIENPPSAKKPQGDNPSYHEVIQAFYRVLDQITEQGETTAINNSVLDAALDLLKVPFGMIGEMDPDGTLKVVAVMERGTPVYGEAMHERLMSKGIPFRGYIAKVIDAGDPVIINDPGKNTISLTSDLLNGHPDSEAPLMNILMVPFKVMGSVLGAIILSNKPGGFTDNDKELMSELARLTSIGRSKILALSAAMRNTSEGIALMDRNGVMSMVNPAMQKMFGYSASELEGRSLLGIFLDPDTGSPLGDAIAGAIMDGTWSGNALGLHRDGTMFPVHMTVTVVEEASAPRTGFMLMARDISVETEVSAKARQYLEVADVMLVALDMDGKVTMLNHRSQEVIGKSRSELLGRNWFDTCVPEHLRPSTKRAFDSLFEAPTQGPMGPANKQDSFNTTRQRRKDPAMEELEFPITDSHGVERVIHWGHSPLKNQKGLVVGILLSGYDITEHNIIEEKLRASEEIYKAILRASPDAIMMSDEKGMIMDCSKRACELHGTNDPYDLIGKNTLDFILPDDHDKTVKSAERALVEGPQRIIVHAKRKNGTIYTAEITSTSIKDKGGKPSWFLGIVRDLSDKEATEARLKEAEQKYRSVFEGSPLGIVRISLKDGRPIMVNQIAAEQLGFRNVDDMLDRIEKNNVIPEATVRQMLERVIKRGQLKDFEVEFKKADGTTGRLLFNAMLVPGADYIDLFGMDIQKAKDIESRLDEVTRAFGGIMDASFLGFARFSIKDGKLSFANKRLARRFGYNTVEEFLENMTSRDMFTDAQRMEIREMLLRDGVLPNYETEVKTKDGTKLWALTYSRLDRATGNIDVMSIDITLMKEAEQRSREAEQMYKALFDKIPMAVFKVNMANNRITIANEAAARMFGYESDLELIDAFQSRELYIPSITRVKTTLNETGVLPSEEHELPRKDGTKVIIEVTGVLDREKGEVTFFGVDVSQSKALETRLRETEQLYRHMLENTPVGISRTRTKDWTVVMANKSMLDILGASSLDEMNILVAKETFYPREKAQKAIDEMRITGFMTDREFEFTRMDGAKKSVLVYAMLDPTGQYIDNVLMDITKLKEAEARLSQAESTYWQMFKASMVGQARVSTEDGRVQVCNETFARMLGYQSVEQLVREFVLDKHVKDIDLWSNRVASQSAGGKGVGWLPSPTMPPGPGVKSQDARTVLIGFIPGVKVPMVRKDGKDLTAIVSGVIYMGRGYMDLTFIDMGLFGN